MVECMATFAAGCVLLWLLVRYMRSRPSNLHPDSVDQVAAVRRGRRGPAAASTSDSSTARQSSSGGTGPRRTSSGGVDTRCPVCLDPHMQYGVVTNCGHTFCAHCILQYWRLDQWPSPARCPVCRRQVRPTHWGGRVVDWSFILCVYVCACMRM